MGRFFFSVLQWIYFSLRGKILVDFSAANFDLIMVPLHLYCYRPVFFDTNATIKYLVILDTQDECTLKGHAGSVDHSRVLTNGFQ